MTSDLWDPLDPRSWRTVPHLSGRMAVKADVQEGRAVFYLNNYENFGGGVHQMHLPALARLTDSDTGQDVDGVLIQAERGEAGVVLVGFRPFAGGNMLATLPEFALLDEEQCPSG
jgi:hypothetical protein